MKGLLQKILKHYDKLIALMVLVGLIGTLVYLAVRVGMIQAEQRKFDRAIAAMVPAHEKVDKVDTSVYERELKAIQEPLQLDHQSWSNHMFVPEERVMCVDCRRPIPKDAEICPFCDYKQPVEKELKEDYDGDEDGIWDTWERAHGLDARDSKDAELDPDGDGFSNFAEFSADPQTDPQDPKSYPPPEAELRLVRIVPDPFKLRFKGSSTMPDGSVKFQINLRGNIRTYFAKLGEDVEGFKLEKYESKEEDSEVGGIKRKKDVSILTLKRGDRLIPLVRGEDIMYSEYIAHLLFALDGTKFQKRIHEKLVLKEQEYEVMSIDIGQKKVIIRRTSDGKEIEVRTFPAGGGPGKKPQENAADSSSVDPVEGQGDKGQ